MYLILSPHPYIFFNSIRWLVMNSVLKDLSHWRSLILVENTASCLQTMHSVI